MRFRTHTIAALLACASVASAHQPYESSAVAQLDGERLELTVTTSTEIARQLVGKPMSDAASLENLRPQLLQAGAELYGVTAGDQPLQLERVFFAERGGKAVFTVIYPVVRGAELSFRAAYLSKLPLGYGGSIEILDDAGKLSLTIRCYPGHTYKLQTTTSLANRSGLMFPALPLHLGLMSSVIL